MQRFAFIHFCIAINYFIEPVMSEEKSLVENIRNARSQLQKLKQEAQFLNMSTTNDPTSLKQIISSVTYELSKADQTIDKSIKQQRNKLPSIHYPKIQQGPTPNYAYKKYRKHYKKTSQKKDESTKLDTSNQNSTNNMSFSVQNRKIKIKSYHQKHIRNDVSIEAAEPQISFLLPQFESKKQSSNSAMRRRFYQDSKLHYIDLRSEELAAQKLLEPIQLSSNIYETNMDKHAKHQFMLIKGRIIDQGPEFGSYKRIYQSVYDKIRANIKRLEAILVNYQVNFAKLDGKKLAYLSIQDNVKLENLLDCLVDGMEIKMKVIPKSRFQGSNGKNRAATLIGSYWKMSRLRKQYLLLRQKTIIIQRFLIRKYNRIQLQKRICARNTKIIQNFQEKIEKLQKQWPLIRQNKRIQIHLNSVQVDEQKRLTIQNYNQIQNAQLSRIFRLKDQNLIIIYVTSNDITQDLINYYYRMLELAEVPKYKDRLIFLTPSSAQKFPPHFSTSKLLYYSSKTLKQLKMITENLPTVLIPGFPCNQLIKICDFLGCYLFSGQPQKLKQFCTKSQVRRFCGNLMLDQLPGAMQMYDYGQFVNTFSVLIIKNPEIETWILKIDDQFSGRGIAYLEVSKSKYIQLILKKVNYEKDQQFFTTDIITETNNQQLTIKLRDYLKEKLEQKLQMATPTLYRTYAQFMGRFIKKGGIIQASPPCLSEKLKYPCVSFCLEPNGQHKIITSYQKILGQPFRSVACSFPQNCLQQQQQNKYIRQICQSLKMRKIFGFFTIDFVTYYNQKTKAQKSWVIDISPYINNYTASFFMFDMLMQGAYFPQKNMYLIEKQQQSKSQTYSVDTNESVSNKNLSVREYIFVPFFHNPNLMKVKVKQFFKQARMQMFNFDVGNKIGLCILLLDQLTSGVLGLLAVGDKKQDGIILLQNMLQFISKISATKNVSYGKSQNLPASDAIHLKDVLSAFSSINRRQFRKNARQKAIKKHQTNGPLEIF